MARLRYGLWILGGVWFRIRYTVANVLFDLSLAVKPDDE